MVVQRKRSRHSFLPIALDYSPDTLSTGQRHGAKKENCLVSGWLYRKKLVILAVSSARTLARNLSNSNQFSPLQRTIRQWWTRHTLLAVCARVVRRRGETAFPFFFCNFFVFLVTMLQCYPFPVERFHAHHFWGK